MSARSKHNIILVILSVAAFLLLFHRYSSLLKFENYATEDQHTSGSVGATSHNLPQHSAQTHQHLAMESYSQPQTPPKRSNPKVQDTNSVNPNKQNSATKQPKTQTNAGPVSIIGSHFTPQDTLDQTKESKGFYYLPGWEIPISSDNQLFVDPREAGIELYNQFSELVAQWAATSSVQCAFYLFSQMADPWVEKIGANGIIQVLEDAHNNINIPNDVMVYHSLGEWLYDKCPVSKWGVEITATMKLHGAALHGAIWASIRNMQEYSDSEIIQYVSNETCFFNTPDLSMVYSACKISLSSLQDVNHSCGGLDDQRTN
jgi:hypothetical protein